MKTTEKNHDLINRLIILQLHFFHTTSSYENLRKIQIKIKGLKANTTPDTGVRLSERVERIPPELREHDEELPQHLV